MPLGEKPDGYDPVVKVSENGVAHAAANYLAEGAFVEKVTSRLDSHYVTTATGVNHCS